MSHEIETSSFIDVAEKTAAFGLNESRGLSLLPRNFESAKDKSELMHESSAPTVRSLWRQAGIVEERLERAGDRFPQITEKAFTEWLGPTILVTAAWLAQNPEALSVALGVISNYLTDIFRGSSQKPTARLVIVVEKHKTYKRISYKGSVEGLKELPSIVERLISND